MTGMTPDQKTIAKLYRSAERRNQHLLGVMDKNDALRHEVKKLQGALLACYFRPEDAELIVEKTIPRHLHKVLAKQAAGEANG